MKLPLCAVLLIGPCLVAQDAPVPIHDIQGPGLRSPYEGKTVTTTGIVTAIRSSGFYVQAPESEYDADWNTSEGLLVFTSSTPPPTVIVGALVLVSGLVVEFRSASDTTGQSVTEISRPTLIQVLSSGNPLPSAWELSRDQVQVGWGFQNLERFEGMRVYFSPGLLVVSPTDGVVNETNATASSNGIFYTVVLGTPRPQQSPDWDGSPERIRIDSAAQRGARRLEVATGMLLTDRMVGTLDFGGNAWTLVPDPGYEASLPVPAAKPLIAPTPAEFTVASMNCERFFDTADDPSTSDAVLIPAAFQGRLAKLSRAIVGILNLPDIIGLQEIETLATLGAIADRVNQEAVSAGHPDPRYRAFLEEGNDPGGIDSGFLVKSSRFVVQSVMQYGKDATYTRPDGRSELLNDRPPLVLRAIIDSRLSLAAIVNHFRSRTNLDDPTDGPRIRLKRRLQAEFLRDLLLQIQRDNPGDAVVTFGDFNSYQFESETIGAVESAGMMNLTNWLPADQNYSYIFDGVAGTFDHILVNPLLRRLTNRIQYTRLNASYPQSLRGDFARPERFSDHESAMASFFLESKAFTAAGVANNFTFLSGPEAPGNWIAVFGENLPASTSAFQVNGLPVSDLYASPTQHVLALPAGLTGSFTLSLAGWSVDIPVAQEQPAIVTAAQTGDRLNVLATGLTAASIPSLTLGPFSLPVDAASPDSRTGFWNVEARLPPYLPRAVSLPLVLTALDATSPRSFLFRLE